MPNLDGYGLSKEIRRIYGSDVVVYGITATVILSKDRYYEPYGFDGVIQKPVGMSTMVKLVHSTRKLNQQRFLEGRKFVELRKENKRIKFLKDKTQLNFEEEEYEENEKKRAMKHIFKKMSIGDDRAEKITMDVIQAIVIFVLLSLMYLLSPEPRKPKSLNTVKSLVYTTLVQYVLVIIFRPSTWLFENMAYIRFLMYCICASEFGCLNEMIPAHHCAAIGIIQWLGLFQTFNQCLFATLGNLLYCLFYFITKPSVTLDLRDDSFLFVVCTVYFVLMNFQFTNDYVHQKTQRKKRWEKLVRDMEQIENTHKLTIDKISHDLVPPAVSMLHYTKEILRRKNEQFMKTNFDEENESATRKRNQDIEKWLLRCLIDLEVAMKNFICCCKIRQDKIKSENDQAISVHEISMILQEVVDILNTDDEGEKTLSLSTQFHFIDNENNVIAENDEESEGEEEEEEKKKTIEEMKNLVVYMDRRNLVLVLTNLVLNSLFHCGGTKIHLDYTLDLYSKTFSFLVEDDGKGVGNLEELLRECGEFVRFKHLRLSNTLGLGIRVCSYLSTKIKDADLKFFQKNERVSQGLSVRFSCSFSESNPYARYENKKNSFANALEDVSEEDVNDGCTIIDKRDLDVLIVDDIIINLMCTERHFRKYGIEKIDRTTRAEVAVKMLKAKKYDVFFVDYNLDNDMTACDIIEEILEYEDGSWLPRVVILNTANIDARVDDAELGNHFDAVLVKPFNVLQFKTVMDMCL